MSVQLEVITDAYVKTVEAERDPIVAEAKTWIVDSPGTYKQVAESLTLVIKPGIKEVKKHCDPICAATNIAHKTATSGRTNLLEPWLKAESIAKNLLGTYDNEQDRLRLAEEKRIEAERVEQERAALKAAQEAEEQRLLDIAEKLEVAGDSEAAAAVLEEPVVVRAPIPAPPAQPRVAPRAKVKGVSSRTQFSGEVTDPDELLRGVLAGSVPRNVLKIDLGALNKLIRANGGEVDYPGVRVVSDRVVSGRSL
jgi:hypothetical protein